MSDYSQPYLVWYGITEFLDQIRKYIAALNVLNSNPGYADNPFLNISRQAITLQLLLDTAKVFDPAQDRSNSNENCSINLLKELCLEDKQKFPLGEKDPLIVVMNALCAKIYTIITKKMRNKKLAHFDLKEVFTGSCPPVNYDDLKTLIEECLIPVVNIGQRYFGAELQFPSIGELEEKYKSALAQLSIN